MSRCLVVTEWYLLLCGLLCDAGLVLLLYQAPNSRRGVSSAVKKGCDSPWSSSISHMSMLSPSVSTSAGTSSGLQSLLLLVGIFSGNAENIWLATVETWWSPFSRVNTGLGGGSSSMWGFLQWIVVLCTSGLQGCCGVDGSRRQSSSVERLKATEVTDTVWLDLSNGGDPEVSGEAWDVTEGHGELQTNRKKNRNTFLKMNSAEILISCSSSWACGLDTWSACPDRDQQSDRVFSYLFSSTNCI